MRSEAYNQAFTLQAHCTTLSPKVVYKVWTDWQEFVFYLSRRWLQSFLVQPESTQAAWLPTNILLQTGRTVKPMASIQRTPTQSPQLHNEAKAACKQDGFHTEGWVRMHSRMQQSALSSLCSIPVFPGLRPTRSPSGHLAPREQPANMTWQYALGLHSFLVALGRMPGITLWVQDCRARCPGLRNKNICQSHRVAGCLSSPTENSRTGNCQTVSRICPSQCPLEGHWELQNPSPRVSQYKIKCTYLPIITGKWAKPRSGSQASPDSC